MKKKEFFQFEFTQRDRVGVIALLLMNMIAAFMLIFYERPSGSGSPPAIRVAFLKDAERLRTAMHQVAGLSLQKENQQKLADRQQVIRQRPTTPKRSFPFDPNNLSDSGWLALGIGPRLLTTIRHYQQKGGRFYKPEDLARLYGLPEAEYQRLKPYVNIRTAANKSGVRQVSQHSPPVSPGGKKLIQRYAVTAVDINKADSLDWLQLPGIGPTLSSRLMHFREKLGGFYNVNQVAELYGLADSVFQKILPYLRCEQTNLVQININDASVDQLAAHPYIRYKLANVLSRYREQHGPFNSLASIRDVQLISEDELEKISPYICIR